MHAYVKECDVIDTKKELYSHLSPLPNCIKLANLPFVKGSLVIGMPVPCSCFVR